jgi:protein translocase subunit secA
MFPRIFLRPCSRRDAYAADITYGTNNEFGFDYLRDNMAYRLEDKVQRGFNYAIVDEVDSILIDEARTPLIISAPDEESSKWYQDFARIIPRLNADEDYKVDEKDRAATLTESGVAKVEKIMGMGNIYEEKGIKISPSSGTGLARAGALQIGPRLCGQRRPDHYY